MAVGRGVLVGGKRVAVVVSVGRAVGVSVGRGVSVGVAVGGGGVKVGELVKVGKGVAVATKATEETASVWLGFNIKKKTAPAINTIRQMPPNIMPTTAIKVPFDSLITLWITPYQMKYPIQGIFYISPVVFPLFGI